MNDINKIESIGAGHDILSVLLHQHHLLRKMLKDAREKIFAVEPNFEDVGSDFAAFRATLDKHLEIEDEIFYPRIIKNLNIKGIDTKSIKEFIAKMKDIGDKTHRFLEDYRTATQMAESREHFKKDFTTIEGMLLMRISAEEESVYLYWDL